MKINPDDFLLSGAIESALNFFYAPMLGAVTAANDRGFFICDHGLCSVYIGKTAVTKAKNDWLALTPVELDQRFIEWQNKWHGLDSTFYNLAVGAPANWQECWQKMADLDYNFWVDSYKVETLDNFGEEIKQIVTSGMKEAQIDFNLFNELISPATPTVPQQAMIDRDKLATTDYLKQYWYINGHWNGGDILTEKFLVAMPHEQITVDFAKRKALHDALNSKLSSEIRRVVYAVRQLTLWREERKVYQQKSGIIMAKIIQDAATALGVDPELLKWVTLEKIDSFIKNPHQFKTREQYCVLAIEAGGKKSAILSGDEALNIIKQFDTTTQTSELKGTGASPGKASGKARIILKNEQFSDFQIGEILITAMTRPEYLPLMKKARAIVTDEGGLTSHAAIVSRELGIPCIVGTKLATKIFKSGDRVEVDANKGVVRKIST